ncbi:MAG: EAL domain-containing protein [Lachnospiraceae bacterium]|nr:EAL domain-containing protein [Lachnospiraceae bacterium]
MGVNRKRVAVLVGQADESYQSRFISGLIEEAFSANVDVCVFSMYRKYQDTTEREKGEGNIFNLVNFKLFDAVILLKDTIQTVQIIKPLEQRIRAEFTGPVLVIERESDFFESVYCDSYGAMAELTEHFIERHHFTDIAFLAGKKWHRHSKERLSAFLDTMEKHGLKVKEGRIIYGDFWYKSGEQAADYLTSAGETLPQAVICANDPMAIGLCQALEKRGIQVPKDIAVAGFDSCEEGQTSPKTITSTVLPAKQTGIYAMQNIQARWKGCDPEPFREKPNIIIGESCGCHYQNMPDLTLRRSGWGTEISEEGFDSVNNTMAENLYIQTDIIDYINMIYSYAYQLKGVESFYLCLSPGWRYLVKDVDLKLKNKGYPERMIEAIRYHSSRKGSIVGIDSMFDTGIMLPEIIEGGENPGAYIFTPLYYEDSCYGYAVVNYGDKARSYDSTYRRWINLVARGFDAIRQKYVVIILKEKVLSLEAERRAAAAQQKDVYEYLTEEQKADYDMVGTILDQNLLTYHFQPIVDVANGQIVAYEALMRTTTERFVSPLDLIRYAGMQSRLRDVERATFLNVLGILDSQRSKFGDRKVYINCIPGVNLAEEDSHFVTELLIRYHDNVVVELTEEKEVDDRELRAMKEYFESIHVEMAVDDYGTGYSNVSNLLRYMPNYVKIDRALLTGIHEDIQKQHFVREIIEFCHDNSIKALAEGVETEDELREVIHLGVDLIQGYCLARPAAELLDCIDEKLVHLIGQFRQEKEDGEFKHIYHAGKTNRISLNMLSKQGVTDIVIGAENAVYQDLSIIGTPKLMTDTHLLIEDGYEGRLTLENACFSNIKNRPCIELGEKCDVTIVLEGENILHHSGILVPEGSHLTLEGDGSLEIRLDAPEFYGIGNELNAKHGSIDFEQDGKITIHANGKKGIGIGSGFGGDIRIKRGEYLLDGRVEDSVGIGAWKGETSLNVENCLIEIEYQAKSGVAIGSYENKMDIYLSKCRLGIGGGGEQYVGIGTIEGESVRFKMNDANTEVNIRSDDSTCIGALRGSTSIFVRHAGLTLENGGRNVLAFGGHDDNGRMELWDVDTKVKIHTALNKDTYFQEDRIRIVNGKAVFTVNDNPVTRRLEFETN